MDAPSPSTTSSRARPRIVAVAALLLVCGGAAIVAAASKAPHRTNGLARLGVSIKGATLTGRQVRITISAKRPVEVRLRPAQPHAHAPELGRVQAQARRAHHHAQARRGATRRNAEAPRHRADR
jgi:hypothetical protein